MVRLMYPKSVPIRSWPALLLIAPLLLLAGCSDPEAEEAKEQAELDKRGRELSAFLLDRDVQTELQEGLAVHLAFGAEADLDLYVTDPLLETVYFANRKSKSGGEISDDVRCGSGEIGVEEILFIAPMPGKYRIGIDYPSECADEAKKAAYALSILHDGKRQEAHGSVSLQRFDVIALEFEIK